MSVLSQSVAGESSFDVARRVEKARAWQYQRNSVEKQQPRSNGMLTLSELERISPLDQESRRLLDAAGRQLGLSARAYVRIIRVSRTIADLAGAEQIDAEHVAEAIQGRLLDRQPLMGH